MSDLIEVKKGDVYIAGGTAKPFKVKSVSKGVATLEETDIPDSPPKPEPEVIETSVKNLIDSDDWKGIED